MVTGPRLFSQDQAMRDTTELKPQSNQVKTPKHKAHVDADWVIVPEETEAMAEGFVIVNP